MGWAFNPADTMYTIVVRRTWPHLGESRDGQLVPPFHAGDLLLATGQRPGARDVSTAAHLLRRH